MIKRLITILNIPRLTPHIALYFIYRKHLSKDIERNIRASLPFGRTGGVFAFLQLLVFHKHFRNLFYYRIGRMKYLCTLLCPPYETFTIANNISIGEGMVPSHCFATIVNAEKIGKNFSVFQNCTIGVSKGKRPIIGDDVTVFSNCVVVGGITIGNNVMIGAGSVVYKSIPDNCVVAGNPARIIKRNGVACNEEL